MTWGSMEDVGFPEGLYTKLLQGFLLQFVLESFVCYFCTFFSRGQDNGWNYEKLEDGASSSAQHAHVTWRGNTTAVGRRSNRGIWIIESVDACLTILDFWSLGQHQQWSHEWPDILSGDNRYRYRYALCFAALFDDTLGAHLGGPVFTEDLLVYQTEVTEKTPCSCEAWATLPICWTSKSRQQKLFLSKRRIITCKGWKDLFCTWIWFQSRNFKSCLPRGPRVLLFFFSSEDPNLALVLDRDIGQTLDNGRLVISSPVESNKKPTKAT